MHPGGSITAKTKHNTTFMVGGVYCTNMTNATRDDWAVRQGNTFITGADKSGSALYTDNRISVELTESECNHEFVDTTALIVESRTYSANGDLIDATLRT